MGQAAGGRERGETMAVISVAQRGPASVARAHAQWTHRAATCRKRLRHEPPQLTASIAVSLDPRQ